MTGFSGHELDDGSQDTNILVGEERPESYPVPILSPHARRAGCIWVERRRASSDRFPLARQPIPTALPGRRASSSWDGSTRSSGERTGLNQPLRFKQRLWQPSEVTP
jgi:hypothetical protein